jgi:hypothetical protein
MQCRPRYASSLASMHWRICSWTCGIVRVGRCGTMWAPPPGRFRQPHPGPAGQHPARCALRPTGRRPMTYGVSNAKGSSFASPDTTATSSHHWADGWRCYSPKPTREFSARPRSPGRPLPIVLRDWPSWGGAVSVAVFGGFAVCSPCHPGCMHCLTPPSRLQVYEIVYVVTISMYYIDSSASSVYMHTVAPRGHGNRGRPSGSTRFR